MLEDGPSAPHSHHAQARMTCVRHDRAKKQGSAPTDPHLYTKTWLYTAGAGVGKRARWLLASLSLKKTRLAVKRTLSCTDVFYTSAERLWTATNLNKWHTGCFFLCYCWFANQVIASSHLLYWTVYYIRMRALAWNNTTNAKADQRRRRVGEATVPRCGTKPLCLVWKHPKLTPALLLLVYKIPCCCDIS